MSLDVIRIIPFSHLLQSPPKLNMKAQQLRLFYQSDAFLMVDFCMIHFIWVNIFIRDIFQNAKIPHNGAPCVSLHWSRFNRWHATKLRPLRGDLVGFRSRPNCSGLDIHVAHRFRALGSPDLGDTQYLRMQRSEQVSICIPRCCWFPRKQTCCGYPMVWKAMFLPMPLLVTIRATKYQRGIIWARYHRMNSISFLNLNCQTILKEGFPR